MLPSSNFVIFFFFLVYANCETNVPSVVIIGAGPAGIAAASRLLENGISNFTILEAEGRLGGRIHSVEFGSAVVDLGAQWCHGEKNNVVYGLVKDLNLLEPTDFSETFYSSSREDVDQNLTSELFELCEEIYNEEKPDVEVSLGEYMIARYNKTVVEKYGNDPEKLKVAREVLNTYKGEVLSLEGAFSWFDPAANSEFEDCEGHHNLNWKGRGYKTILDVLMKKYPDPEKKLLVEDKIVFNTEVTEIKWDTETAANHKKATVMCADNSIYNADHVILTVSLGVLKDKHETLFNPALPQEKINAIEELGIGAVGKVFLHFPHIWWADSNVTDIFLYWHEADREQLVREFPQGPNDNGQSWLGDLVGFLSADKNPNVLTAWFTGKFVPQIELLSDEMMVDGVMFALNKFLGHRFNISKPNKVLRHNWYTNPHFRGVYSFETVKSRKRDVPGAVALSKPLTSSSGRTTLLFAGEATNRIHSSTVHGAIETGFREADRIIKLHK